MYVDSTKKNLYIVNIDGEIDCLTYWEIGYAMGKEFQVIGFKEKKENKGIEGINDLTAEIEIIKRKKDFNKFLRNINIDKYNDVSEFMRRIKVELKKFDFYFEYPDEWEIQYKLSKGMV